MAPLARASKNRIRQTRLQFASFSSSSPAQAGYAESRHDGQADGRFQGGSAPSPPTTEMVPVQYTTLPTPEPSSQVGGKPLDSPISSPLSDPPSSPASPDLPAHDPAADDDEDDEDDVQPPSSKRRKSNRLHEHAFPSSPTRRSSRLRNGSSPGLAKTTSWHQATVNRRTSSPVQNLSDLGSPETSDEDGHVLAAKPTQRRRPSKRPDDDVFVVADDRIEYLSSDEEPGPGPATTRRRPANDDFVVDNDFVEINTSDEDTGSVVRTKLRRVSRKQTSPKTPRQRSRRQQAELEDDLEDLKDSGTETRLSRTRGGPVTTQRDQAREHFELLKRRRAGEKIPRVEDSDEEQSEGAAVDLDLIGHPTNLHELSDTGSPRSSADSDPEPEAEAEPEVNEDDDFIEEDQAPSSHSQRRPHPDIPLEFTSYASAKPRELFPHIIEWLVKNKIAPAFPRDDPVYRLAFDRVNDQVKAQAGSRLISAAWNATFKHAILARPQMKVWALPGFDEDNVRACDACNRTNHPARYDFVFQGQAYDNESLEPVEQGSDDSDDDNEEGTISVDGQGHQLASANQHFYLGRFCAANAETGHKLTHWKWHLNQSLLNYLEAQGVLRAEAIVARDKMNHKKREKEAERILDEMESTGVVREMWQSFQDDLEDARVGMEGYERKAVGKRRDRPISLWAQATQRERERVTDNNVRQVIRVEDDSDGD